VSAATKQALAMDWPSRYINIGAAYSYSAAMKDMAEIDARYPTARVVTIGKSLWGNPIRALVLGRPSARKKILIQASIHAREILTAQLALRQAEILLEAAARGAVYGSMHVADILDQVEIWVVPVSNPDGTLLVTKGFSAVPSAAKVSADQLLKMNGGSNNFSRWKANGRGVDLNRNFDGKWGLDSKHLSPGSEGFAGTKPFSEPEAEALRALTVQKDFAISVSYHASGEILYWYNPFNTAVNTKDKALASQISLLSGYRVLPTSSQVPNGGYRDWVNLRFDKPSFTIEVGTGTCPLPQSQFSRAWLKNRHVVLRLAASLFPNSLIGRIR
jgi:g-D-glutamyl-meso-diaminopimelate peptidase